MLFSKYVLEFRISSCRKLVAVIQWKVSFLEENRSLNILPHIHWFLMKMPLAYIMNKSSRKWISLKKCFDISQELWLYFLQSENVQHFSKLPNKMKS